MYVRDDNLNSIYFFYLGISWTSFMHHMDRVIGAGICLWSHDSIGCMGIEGSECENNPISMGNFVSQAYEHCHPYKEKEG